MVYKKLKEEEKTVGEIDVPTAGISLSRGELLLTRDRKLSEANAGIEFVSV